MDINDLLYLFYNAGGAIILVIIVTMGFGVMFRLITVGGLLKWGAILVVGWAISINVGIPYYYQLYSEHGKVVPFLVICAVIIVLMYSFDFSRAILASTIGSFLYNDVVRRILWVTGALAALYYVVDKFAEWLME
jgi:hypothetical protein